MRLFFALQPDANTSLDVISFRDSTLPPLDRPVPIANLHVTLAFLGEVTETRLEQLFDLASGVSMTPFEITFDELGYWPKPRILWIGASHTPAILLDVVRQLTSVARGLHIPMEKRHYRAHITIARNCRTPPPASALPPHIAARFTAFYLFCSRRT
ncbi:MAG: RNA 2',3'-cyclic phosphodiesterase, partial [Pseudomonadales bacterium]